MKSVSHMVVLILVQELLLSHLSIQGRVGDGTISLYTGRAINATDTRGSCLADGVLYMSETAIPRQHPCHYCICYQSQVACYWKQCAAPPVNCDVMEFEHVCNPSLYVCAIPQRAQREPKFGYRRGRPGAPRVKRKLIRKIKRRRISRGAQTPHLHEGGRLPIEEGFPVQFETAWTEFERRRHRRSISSESRGISRGNGIADTSCTVYGVQYNLGEVIGVASDVCMECRCAAGVLFCSPKCCFLPSPFSLGADPGGGNALFIRARGAKSPSSSDEEYRAPHPLHYVSNQLVDEAEAS